MCCDAEMLSSLGQDVLVARARTSRVSQGTATGGCVAPLMVCTPAVGIGDVTCPDVLPRALQGCVY